MSRTIYHNKSASDPSEFLSIAQGGTSSISIADAQQNLHAIPTSKIAVTNGIVPLDSSGYIPLSVIPAGVVNKSGELISGPITLGIGLIGSYQINNYNSNNTYTVTAASGSVSRSGNIITYTAPIAKGPAGFVVNGNGIYVNVVDPAESPIITGPLFLLENAIGTYRIQNFDPISTYVITPIQGNVSVVGDVITYTAPAGDGINDLGGGFIVNALNFNVRITAPLPPVLSGQTSLPVGTTTNFRITNYQPPATYNVSVEPGNGVVSISGDTIAYKAPDTVGVYQFKINGVFIKITATPPQIETPIIVAPANAAINLGPYVTLSATAFKLVGGVDTQKSATWELASDAAFKTIIASSVKDETNLTSWKTPALKAGQTFYARVLYTGKAGESSNYSVPISFSTKDIYLPAANTAKLLGTVLNTNYGYSVSLNATGDTMAVGAPYQNSFTGVVYIYNLVGTSWQLTQTINGNGGTGSYFGCSVSFDGGGTNLVVGAFGESGYAGAAYVYNIYNSTWQLTIRLEGSNSVNSNFGTKVTISQDSSTIAVTAPLENSNTGACYVYRRRNGAWRLAQTLTGSISTNSYFGCSVSLDINGNTVVVGANGENKSAGAVYVFTAYGSSWSGKVALTPTTVAGSNFGQAVAISPASNLILIGAPTDDNTTQGAVYIYSITTGIIAFVKKITTNNPDPTNGNAFGVSLGVNSAGTAFIVGANKENLKGGVYIYALDKDLNESLKSYFTTTYSVSQSYGLSTSLGYDGSTAAVGASLEGSGAGAVYVYS